MPQDQIQIKTPEFVSLQFRLSGLGSRATAMIIDQVLLTFVNLVLIFALIFMTLMWLIGMNNYEKELIISPFRKAYAKVDLIRG